jgi:ATP-dependent DNA ligase
VLPDYTPMAPTLVREPFHRDGWVYEEKVDGWRILAYKDGDRVRLISRNGRDHTRRFAGIAAAIAKLAARALVLDGEVAIYDERLSLAFRLAARTRCRRGRHAAAVHGLRLTPPGRARPHRATVERSARPAGERCRGQRPRNARAPAR